MEPLSIVANVAQLLSLVDTIWRISKETHRIIVAVKNVPDEIQQLGLDLEEVETLLLNLRRYCSQYESQNQSMSTQEPSPLKQLFLTLQSLQKEYTEVSKIVSEELCSNQLSKRYYLKRLGGKFKLVLGERLGTASKNLCKYKLRLSLHLQVLSSLNDLTVNDRLERIHNVVASLGRPLESETQPIVTEGTIAISQSSTSIQPIDSLTEQLKAITRAVEESSQGCEQYVDCWTGHPQHIRQAALPLSLLRPKIKEALQLMMGHGPGYLTLSASDAEWIRSELESLLATSDEKSAVALRSARLTAKEAPSTVNEDENNTAPVSSLSMKQTRPSPPALATQFILQDAPAGSVSIRAQWSQDQSGQIHASDIALMLTPRPEITTNGIFISLSRYYEKLQTPLVRRQIVSYVVVEPDSPAFTCVSTKDIHGLRNLLRTRNITPTVRSTDNESLLAYAARHLRFEICELLLNEGADPNNCSWECANAIYAIRNAFWYRPSNYSIPKSTLNKMLRLFVAAGCDINSTALGGNPLHFTVGHSSPGADEIEEGEVCALIDLLICLGCNIEHRNTDGLTPLLYNAILPRWHGVTVLRALLQWGANPHATTNLDEGALHLAIGFSGFGASHGREEEESLDARLIVLLEARFVN